MRHDEPFESIDSNSLLMKNGIINVLGCGFGQKNKIGEYCVQ
jgi:hypothetical protein